MKTWADTIEFYRDLVDEHGWRQKPMLEFVSWLAASKYSRVLYPSTSHEALGLSTVATYEERLRRPMVYVVYSATTDSFVVYWQRGQGDQVRAENVDMPQTPEVFGRILSWLGVPEQSAASSAT